MPNPARLRANKKIRSLVRETRIFKDELIMPLFFHDQKGSQEIPSMPGICKLDGDLILKEIDQIQKCGIKAVLLFGASSKKDHKGTASFDETSAFHKTLKKIKQNSDIILITDVCLCAYTDHGQCYLPGDQNNLSSVICHPSSERIDLQNTLNTLAKIALSHAHTGADIVAPSAMMDFQVKAIRTLLDKEDYHQTAILSYAVKYASGFYGPFRDIYDSSPASGDRKNHQMDPANRREAVKEACLDVAEGADLVMVKPAICFLDIISDVKQAVQVPLAAYNVSGEYSMIKAAAQKGWLDEQSAACEMLTSIKRAGADLIITYWAKEAARWLDSQE